MKPPGVVLVVLRRGRTSTDVLLVSALSGRVALPCSAGSDEKTQWDLAEELLEASLSEAARSLYASSIGMMRDGVHHGVFVSFVGPEMTDAVGADVGSWVDLRDACRDTEPHLSGVLAQVRERFVARSPDEALRVR